MALDRWGGPVLDCNGDATVFRIGWAILFGLTLIAFLNCYVRKQVIGIHVNRLVKKRETKPDLAWWHHKPLLIVLVVMPVYFVCMITLCILKVANPRTSLVFVDTAPTVMWMCVSVIMAMFTVLTLPARVKTILKKALHMSGRNRGAADRGGQRLARRVMHVGILAMLTQIQICVPILFFPMRGDEGPSATSGRGIAIIVYGATSGLASVLMVTLYMITLRRFLLIMRRTETIHKTLSKRIKKSTRQLFGRSSVVRKNAAKPLSTRTLMQRRGTLGPEDKKVQKTMTRARKKISAELITVASMYVVQGLFQTIIFVAPSLWRHLSIPTFAGATIATLTSFSWASQFSMKIKVQDEETPKGSFRKRSFLGRLGSSKKVNVILEEGEEEKGGGETPDNKQPVARKNSFFEILANKKNNEAPTKPTAESTSSDAESGEHLGSQVSESQQENMDALREALGVAEEKASKDGADGGGSPKRKRSFIAMFQRGDTKPDDDEPTSEAPVSSEMTESQQENMDALRDALGVPDEGEKKRKPPAAGTPTSTPDETPRQKRRSFLGTLSLLKREKSEKNMANRVSSEAAVSSEMTESVQEKMDALRDALG